VYRGGRSYVYIPIYGFLRHTFKHIDTIYILNSTDIRQFSFRHFVTMNIIPTFWKTWKTKANKRHTAANDVDRDGCTNATDIANSFASRFQQACLPNSSDYSGKLKKNLVGFNPIQNYNGYLLRLWINV